jgi:hypothetical protein
MQGSLHDQPVLEHYCKGRMKERIFRRGDHSILLMKAREDEQVTIPFI